MASEKLVITNIGQILSGKLEAPILDGDCVVSVDGRITDIGYAKDMDLDNATVRVHAHGVTLTPGLIDSHVHPVIGDYTPRQQQLNWIDSCLHGGVTTMISAGEVHAPGRPKDIVGLKAMAIASQRWYENFRPSGVKMLAGAPVIEDGMVESDFKELADAGVKLLGEARHAAQCEDGLVHVRLTEHPRLAQPMAEPRRRLHFIDDPDLPARRDIGDQLTDRVRADIDRGDALADRRGVTRVVGGEASRVAHSALSSPNSLYRPSRRRMVDAIQSVSVRSSGQRRTTPHGPLV